MKQTEYDRQLWEGLQAPREWKPQPLRADHPQDIIRVTRTIVHEGPREWVEETLRKAACQPDGQNQQGLRDTKDKSIRETSRKTERLKKGVDLAVPTPDLSVTELIKTLTEDDVEDRQGARR